MAEERRPYFTDSEVPIETLLAWARSGQLLGKRPSKSSNGKPQDVHISRFRLDDQNPRTVFQDLPALASSLSMGVKEPVKVAILDNGLVLLLEGHRRFISLIYDLYNKALAKARILDRDAIAPPPCNDPEACLPCLVQKEVPNPLDRLLTRLVVNTERQEFHPIDEAHSFQRLIKDEEFTPHTIFERLGGKFTVRYIENRLALLNLLSGDGQGGSRGPLEYFLAGNITEDEALQLALLPENKQMEVLRQITIQQISLRALKALVSQILGRIGPEGSSAESTSNSSSSSADSAPNQTGELKKKKRHPDFAAATKIPVTLDPYTEKKRVLEIGDGTVVCQMTISGTRRAFSISLTPNKIDIGPNELKKILVALAFQI